MAELKEAEDQQQEVIDYISVPVAKVQKATPVMSVISLKAPHLLKQYETPGQYVMIEGNDGLPMPMTFVSPPKAKTQQILLKSDSRLSNMLGRGQKEINISEVRGQGIPHRDVRGRKVLLVSMGTGAAPFLSLAKHLQASKKTMEGWTWVHGLKQPDHLPLKAQWTTLQKEGVEVNLAYSAHQGTPPTRVQAMLYQMPPLNTRTMLAMVCGSQEMMTSVRQILLAKGFTQDRIILLGG